MADVSPLLSICLPTFNRAWMLRRNLEFHLAEFRARGLSFEIVVVDDCSTDDTPRYLEALADVPELSAFRRHKNSGFLDNYAFAMQRARGRYAVFLGDDDLLIPDQIMACLAVLQSDETIGVIQAPWLLVDERPGGGEMGPFYHVPAPTRIPRGDHAALSKFIFDFHVFPEFMILRRDVLARSISAPCPFIFWAFLFTGRALQHCDILFLPTPFARVTAVSADPRVQQGNRETMFQWDHYRGGVEYIAARAQRAGGLPGDRAMFEAITRFMAVRKTVALRLLVGERHWIEAYVLIHRIAAYQAMPVSAEDFKQISFMAALTAAAKDAISFAEGPVLVDPKANRSVFDLLRPELRDRLRFTDEHPADLSDGPRAHLVFAPTAGPALGPRDAIFTVSEYMAQFG